MLADPTFLLAIAGAGEDAAAAGDLDVSSEILIEGSGAVVSAGGPAADGGYYLVGMTRPHPELFESIPWSSADVLARTRTAIERAGLSYRLLEPRTRGVPPIQRDTRASLISAHDSWPSRRAPSPEGQRCSRRPAR